MATSDEPPPAGLTAGLSRGPWSPQTFDVVRRSPPFWGGTPAPPSSNFLDLNAPFEEDPLPAGRADLVSRGLSNFVDQLGSGSSGPVEVSFLHPAKGSEGDGLRSFLDATGIARNHHDADGASAVRDQDPGLDTGPFVDYLSQFSGKKESDAQENEPPKAESERTDFPDELLSLSSLYNKKRGGAAGGDAGGRLVADGAALFLASGRGQEGAGSGLRQAEQQIRHVKESRVGLLGNFASNRLDDLEHFREVEKSHVIEGQQPGLSIEERSLFPRNVVNSDSFFQMPNIVREERMPNMVREERVLLPMNVSARETLDLSNNLSFKEEKAAMSRHARTPVESSKEGMSLSLKRSYEDMDAAEEYNRRREEEVVQASLYGRQPDARDGEEIPDAADAAHMKRRRDRAGGEEQRFQHDLKRVQNDQSANDDKSIVWPPVVIIENTRLGWDEEKKKWKGLGHDDIRKSLKNVENLEYAKVKCLFDMNGQKSSALVIFPSTFEGYFEAEALSDQLERSGKGRDQWMRVRPQDLNPRTMRGWNTPDLVSPDGKRILYGYLAQPEDIQRADPHKNSLKWFVESFNEKVRKPAQQRHQDKELQRATYLKLEEEARLHKQRLESDRNEVHDLMQQVKERTSKLEIDKERVHLEQQKHEQDLELRRTRYEDEKRSRMDQFYQREEEIRKKLEEYKQTLLHERQQKAQEAAAVRHGINETIRKHEAKLAEDRQLEAMEEMKSEAKLRAEMEKKLFELEQKRQMNEKEMQGRQQEQLRKLKMESLKEKEELLQHTISEQELLMKEMDDAVKETQSLKQMLGESSREDDHGTECVVCLEEFGQVPDRQRAHYKDCDHANVCIGCAKDMWKSNRRNCPYCNTLAKHMPARLPPKIYL